MLVTTAVSKTEKVPINSSHAILGRYIVKKKSKQTNVINKKIRGNHSLEFTKEEALSR